MQTSKLLLAASLVILSGCGGGTGTTTASALDPSASMRTGQMVNPSAYIPAQCYTKTQDALGRTHNPCFACHISSQEPNYVNDAEQQLSYGFPSPALQNHWSNLFADHSARIAQIDDAAILSYVRQDNYRDADGSILLARQLKNLPQAWDADHNGKWDGFVPDAYFSFDPEGFDHDLGGAYTGWRAFAYYPFLGTFWPTNGSTDDVLLRLSKAFQQTEAGEFNLSVYKTNLAIVEAIITRRDVSIDATDEKALGVDLDKNGKLGTATLIKYDWAPNEGRNMSFVGQAHTLQAAGNVHLAAGLFPEGTEFIHSVRYIDVDDQGGIHLAKRMKELRYSIKRTWYNYSDLLLQAQAEVKEGDQFPERLRSITGSAEVGLSNGQGWNYQSFIEDKQGALRPQTYEENVFCIGCHSGIGATTDGNFSFARKFAGQAPELGWYHWSKAGLNHVPDPLRADGQKEYTHYLQQNGAGDEFRTNMEVLARFFNSDGSVNPTATAVVAGDVSQLLLPSRDRALALNKAYKVIVEQQSYILGRDATVQPVANVHVNVTDNQTTGIGEAVTGPGTLQSGR